MKRWEIIESAYVFESPFIRIRRDRCLLPDGRLSPDLYLVDKEDFSMVVALTKGRDLILVKQYKHGAGEVIYELPAGFVEPGESPMESARRELLDETGYRADKWEHLGSFLVIPGFVNMRGHFFLAKDAVRVGGGRPDEYEDIEVELFSLDEVLSRVRGFDFHLLADANSLLALLLAQERMKGD
mgnify:CR=1 FL=1